MFQNKFTVIVQSWKSEQLKARIKNGVMQVSGRNIPDLKKITVSQGDQSVSISSELNLSLNWISFTGTTSTTFNLPYRGIVTIGRSDNNIIQLKNNMISGRHTTLRCENGTVSAIDGYNGKASSNGTYLNGKRLSTARMQSGDYLDIVNARIRLVNTTLYFEQVEGILKLNQLQGEAHPERKQPIREPLYRRSPRLREGMPVQEIILAKAPSKMGMFQKRRGLFSSLIGSGAMIASSVAVGAVSPALLAARAAGLVAPIANIAMGSSDNKKNKKLFEKQEAERREKYGAYIEAQKARILLTAEQQRKILKAENPNTEEWNNCVQNLRPNLWERRPTDSDFLDVRIGMGYEQLCVPVKTPATAMGFQMEVDEAELMAQQIVDETRIVDDIPARVQLGKYGSVGIVGQRPQVVGLLKNMLISLTSAHFYEDVRIVGIFDNAEQNVWEALRWLPHIWDDEKQSRFLAFDGANTERINDTFYEILRQRLSVRQSYDQQTPLPHYIFILGSYQAMKRSKLMADLLKNSPMAGATTIFAYNLGDKDSQYQRTFLPPECQFIIDTNDINGPCAYEFARADRRFMFTLDTPVTASQFDSFCRSLSSIKVEIGAGKLELPSGVTFLEGLGVSNVRELNVWENWSSYDKKVLNAPLAVLQNGKSLELDIGDMQQPPVSLVAGMAGSGKSEFLKTWILSLAVQYSPEELSIVIIDYKGGSMANSIDALPHVIGKITNIESGDMM